MIKHVYRCDPVDFWSFIPSVRVPRINEAIDRIEEIITNTISNPDCSEFTEELIEAQLDLIKDRKTIVEVFKKLGEEFRGEDGIIMVPDGCELMRAYLVKADNNGTTYLFSPVAMDKAPGEEMNV